MKKPRKPRKTAQQKQAEEQQRAFLAAQATKVLDNLHPENKPKPPLYGLGWKYERY